MGLLKSIGKLAWLVGADILMAAVAALRGDWGRAADHVRHLATFVHDDLLKAVELVQKMVPAWPAPQRDLDRILIIKLDRIGDMVTTTPVLDALSAAFPQAKVDIVGHPVPLSLLGGDERVGELIPYKTWMYHPLPIVPGGPRLWKLMWTLWRRRYPLVVYLRGSLPFLGLALTSRFAASRFVPGEPVVTRYLKAIQPITRDFPRTRARLHIDADASEFASSLLHARNGSHGPAVVIHAAASSHAKMWPTDRFAELADQLVEIYDARVHFVGSRADKAVLDGIAARGTHTHDYHTTLTLPQVVALVAGADLFVGNDSGLSHVAAAVGTKTVIVWGPANLTMARPEAGAETCQVLYHELPCRDRCPETYCVNDRQFECLTLTRTSDVLQSIDRLMPEPARS